MDTNKTATKIALDLNREAERLTQLAFAYKQIAMILSGMVRPEDIDEYVQRATIARQRTMDNE
jgi:hypothetical protein